MPNMAAIILQCLFRHRRLSQTMRIQETLANAFVINVNPCRVTEPLQRGKGLLKAL
jgi:hypothetical protein